MHLIKAILWMVLAMLQGKEALRSIGEPGNYGGKKLEKDYHEFTIK